MYTLVGFVAGCDSLKEVMTELLRLSETDKERLILTSILKSSDSCFAHKSAIETDVFYLLDVVYKRCTENFIKESEALDIFFSSNYENSSML